ncbi:DUF6732 family protein [Cognatiyoonia koreensis]|nr:DUF6732 family protein [Cognatiyoonia koreensis]
MRLALSLAFTVLGSGVAAHPGHLADVAGHDHWVAGAAIGLIILTGLYGALKGKKTEDPEETAELEEEAA